ncbi:MAG: sulfotransferase [Deltaproteobacteria bacterium]|nr:sulfotransferase [Deltaproteobacteria bacterium]MBW2536568.1 sulfotransferase [Deltaproteobacteria bacterium]
MARHLTTYRTILKTFGPRLRPLGTFGLLQLHRLVNATTRGLDTLLYPALRETAVERPVFILGNPRSGTTFVHRFLLHTGQLCAFELWEMLLPALTARVAFEPVVHRLAPLSPARYHSSAAHETSLRDVETDDAMAFFHFVDGGFLWSYFLAWDDQWGSETSRRYFDPARWDRAERERMFRYLEACWRRNRLAHGGKRNLVKSATLTLDVADLLRRYPDCRIIYLVRDPVATIPSGMSLLTGVIDQAYDFWNTTSATARARYLENLYQASCHLYRAFHDAHQRGDIPAENVTIVTYPQLMGELEATMERLVAFAGLEPASSFWERVESQADRQRARRSAHRYSLEKFGLSAERIRRDLAFLYDAYDL